MCLLNAQNFCEDEADIHLITLRKGELILQVCNYGARIVSLNFPDNKGEVHDLVMGCDRISGYYKKESKYFGATIGRFANRIARGKFEIDGVKFELPQNNGINNLHSADAGMNYRKWKVVEHSATSVTMSLIDQDGHGGFPGTLEVKVKYLLKENHQIEISYSATTDKPTHINLSHHSYFNLSGNFDESIENHYLLINAEELTEVNEHLIPTGNLLTVKGSPFDFRSAKPIGLEINDNHPQLKLGNGYDHNFVLSNKQNLKVLAARAEHRSSGRFMEVYTTEPGLQFYSSNFVKAKEVGKSGQSYGFRSGFCLEPQHFPDSPNQPNFPSTLLQPNQIFNSKTVYKLGLI